MTMWLRQSTAVVVSVGPFVNPTDGVTLVTSLVSALDHASTGIFLSKNGGTLTIRHATVTASAYDAYGNYKVTLDTTDTGTLGTLRLQFAAAASCLPVFMDFMVVPANVWDSMFGSDLLQVDTEQFGNANLTAASGIPEVKVASIAAGAITATSIASDAITAAKLHSDVTTELQSGLATAAALDTVDDFLDTEIAAIKAKTDQLTFTVTNQVDSNTQYVNDVQVNGVGTAGNPWGP